MIYIALSVLCSVIVSVLLKLAPGWQVDLRQAIGGGYLVASVLCLLLLHPSPDLIVREPLSPAWFLLLVLGVALPAMFLVLATSVDLVGIVRTDAAMRLSLVLPLIAAFTLFGEILTMQKGTGVLLGLAAIACIVTREEAVAAQGRSAWKWPLIVFVGMGVIDILFKRVAQETGVPFADILFASFSLAFLLSLLYLAGCYRRGRAQWRWRHAGGALLIGGFNFGNIVFYILAHRALSDDPALVFSAMNIGVIVLATLVGVGWFRERLSRLNGLGLLLAVGAIAVLASA